MVKIPYFRHLRKRHTARIRHSKNLAAFIALENPRLGTLTASGLLTTTTNPADATVVVIGAKTYTIQATLTNVDGHVKQGATLAATLLNLQHAINAAGGVSGTDFAALNTINADVTAVAGATTLAVTAKVSGTAPNSKATTTTVSGASWASATLTGGAAAFDTVARLKLNTAAQIAAAASASTLK